MMYLLIDKGEILAVYAEPADGLVAASVPDDFVLVDTRETYYFENGEIKTK